MQLPNVMLKDCEFPYRIGKNSLVKESNQLKKFPSQPTHSAQNYLQHLRKIVKWQQLKGKSAKNSRITHPSAAVTLEPYLSTRSIAEN